MRARSSGSCKRLSPCPPSRPRLRLPRPLSRLASPACLAHGRLVRPCRLGPAPAPRVRHHASFSLAHARLVHANVHLVHARPVHIDTPAHTPELKFRLRGRNLSHRRDLSSGVKLEFHLSNLSLT
ncbi:hypothetical protein DFH09DRAFT_1372422 [Mycena vulgaris]|nr:hypothetical protein DFH09DRAFT_1372422 [Mycena vulgaris]